MQRITPNLWFEDQAEEAAKFYTAVFKNSKINTIAHYGLAGPLLAGTVMMVDFELDGRQFTAINGGVQAIDTRPRLEVTADAQHLPLRHRGPPAPNQTDFPGRP
jgi:predicted 3-demethylubiquinone-9 3-methyltransferase (glyoxalase superfamily)